MLFHDHISKNVNEPLNHFKIQSSDPYDSVEESSLSTELSKQIHDEVKKILSQEEKKREAPKRTTFVTESAPKPKPERQRRERKDDSDSDEQFFDSRQGSDDESVISRSSIFSIDKAEMLMNSLLEVKEYSEDVKRNHSDKSTLVKEALLQIKQVMAEVKEKAPKLKTSPTKKRKN